MAEDHKARIDIATIVERLDQHIIHCDDRSIEVSKAMGRIEHGVAGLYKRWWQLAVSVIIILLGMIGSALYVGGKISALTGGAWP